MARLHKEKKYLTNVRGVYITTGTVMTQTQQYVIKYSKILKKCSKRATKEHYSRLTAKSEWNIVKKGNRICVCN
jgi:hypothetical protein